MTVYVTTDPGVQMGPSIQELEALIRSPRSTGTAAVPRQPDRQGQRPGTTASAWRRRCLANEMRRTLALAYRQ